MLNSDLWFHLAIGRAVVTTGEVPAVDGWSYSAAGLPWHNHEWLSGVFFHLWASTFGVASLVWWQWGILAATGLVLYSLARQRVGRVASLALVGVALLAARPFFDIRPHLWTLLGFVVVLRLALLGRWPYVLVPLFALWANLHAGVVIGLAALGGIAAARLVAAWRRREPIAWREPALLGACVVATLLNPFGWRVLWLPFEMVLTHGGNARTRLVEWASPLIPGGIESPLYLPLVAAALPLIVHALVVGWRRSRAECLAAAGLVVLTLAMSLNSRRFVPLFALAVVMMTAVAMGESKRRRRTGHRFTGHGLAWVLVALVAAGAAWRLGRLPFGSAAFVPLTRTDRMPVDCLRFLERNGLEGNVFAYFLWGGYVLHARGGALRVFIDPRSETVYPPSVWDAYHRAAGLQPGWQDVLDGADFVLWPFAPASSRAFVEAVLASGEWRLLHSDGQGVLLARRDLALPGLVPTPPSGWRAFGLARQALAQGQHAAAEQHLEEALRHEPQLGSACVDLLSLQRRRHADAAASRTQRRCNEIFPGLAAEAGPAAS